MRVSCHPLLQYKEFQFEGRDSSKVGLRLAMAIEGYLTIQSDKTPRKTAGNSATVAGRIVVTPSHPYCLIQAVCEVAVSSVAAAFSITERSISILILSPTRTPPASSAIFQFRPQSLRFIVPVALSPARLFP